MRVKEVIKAWSLDEIDTHKVKVVLKTIQAENNRFIQEKHQYLDEAAERDLGNPMDLEAEINDFWRIQEDYEFAITENEQIKTFIESIQEPEQAPETSLPKIIWKGKTADLARIYKDLVKAGLITITGRDFSKHFIDKKGTDIPQDFTENLSTKQDCFSPKQDVESLQLKIRGMKSESGE
jgi:hypothetical protein